MANFSRFELEVCLDIPANILAEIPNGQPEALATMSASDELSNFTRAADTTDDYSTIRVHFRGTNGYAYQTGKKLLVTVKVPSGTFQFRSKGFEIIHCQGC